MVVTLTTNAAYASRKRELLGPADYSDTSERADGPSAP